MEGLKNKKILVSGGYGLIGSQVVRDLRASGAFPHINDPKKKEWSYSEIEYEIHSFDGFVMSAYPDESRHLYDYYTQTEAIIKNMKKEGKKGSIVLLSSIYGMGGSFDIYKLTEVQRPSIWYHTIKTGIIGMMKGLACQEAPDIRVNCVSPGGIEDKQDRLFKMKYKYKCPMERMAKVEEVSNAILFLLSDLSSYITGHNLVVDGGWTAR